MASVSLINIIKTFDGLNNVLDGINIEIDNGAFFVIVGPSGCGKTTMLNLIAGLESVSRGKIFINGKNVNGIEPKDRNIAMVFQSHALYPHLNVYGNLAFALKANHVDKRLIDEKVRNVANMLGVSNLYKRKPHQLSGGQKQRVAIGRAIIREPLVFLMDEPLSNLDTNLKSSMRDELKRLHKELHATFVYVTHDQIEAMTLATQLVVMNEGKIQQIGTPYDIFMNPKNIFVAKFMSSYPLNLFRCKLKKKGNEYLVFFLGGTLHIILDSNYIGIEDIYIGIRTEGFEFSAKNSGIQLEVLYSEVLGVNTLFKCTKKDVVHNEEINVLLPTQPANEISSEIFANIKLDMLMIFDANTGDSINIQEKNKMMFKPDPFSNNVF